MSDCPEKCPVSVRVDVLKEEFERHRTEEKATHKELFQRVGGLEQDSPAMKAMLKSNGEKLAEVCEDVKTLLEKPSKRWDALVGCICSATAGAVIGFLFSRLFGA